MNLAMVFPFHVYIKKYFNNGIGAQMKGFDFLKYIRTKTFLKHISTEDYNSTSTHTVFIGRFSNLKHKFHKESTYLVLMNFCKL